MPNNTDKTWERRERRTWSDEENDWIAPRYIPGDPSSGPEKHNRNTYVNWHCRCRECKRDNSRKQSEWIKVNPPSASVPVAAQPSSDAPSDGCGATLTA